MVFALTGILAYIIPDVPSSVREKLARERFLEREALVSHDNDIDSAASRRSRSGRHLTVKHGASMKNKSLPRNPLSDS